MESNTFVTPNGKRPVTVSSGRSSQHSYMQRVRDKKLMYRGNPNKHKSNDGHTYYRGVVKRVVAKETAEKQETLCEFLHVKVLIGAISLDDALDMANRAGEAYNFTVNGKDNKTDALLYQEKEATRRKKQLKVKKEPKVFTKQHAMTRAERPANGKLGGDRVGGSDYRLKPNETIPALGKDDKRVPMTKCQKVDRVIFTRNMLKARGLKGLLSPEDYQFITTLFKQTGCDFFGDATKIKKRLKERTKASSFNALYEACEMLFEKYRAKQQ